MSFKLEASFKHRGTALVASDAMCVMAGNTDVVSMMAGDFGVAAMFLTGFGVGITGLEGTDSTGLVTIRTGHAGNHGLPSSVATGT